VSFQVEVQRLTLLNNLIGGTGGYMYLEQISSQNTPKKVKKTNKT
jgi:hypothetical protein